MFTTGADRNDRSLTVRFSFHGSVTNELRIEVVIAVRKMLVPMVNVGTGYER